mmetsp:Transcript_22082/g.51531  ORF Transcript_22082/g.51531 Transcript_22082/m.51531 type:complete len:243 (+) Transcript_22082:1726-2454(+)
MPLCAKHIEAPQGDHFLFLQVSDFLELGGQQLVRRPKAQECFVLRWSAFTRQRKPFLRFQLCQFALNNAFSRIQGRGLFRRRGSPSFYCRVHSRSNFGQRGRCEFNWVKVLGHCPGLFLAREKICEELLAQLQPSHHGTVATKKNVSPTTCHVGGNGDSILPPTGRNNLCLTSNVLGLCVQQAIGHAQRIKQLSDNFGVLNIRGANENRPSDSMCVVDLSRHCFPFPDVININLVVLVLTPP